MYNKRKVNKFRNKKLLHKVKKQWVVVSLALFMMIGGQALISHHVVSADPVNSPSVQKIHSNQTSPSVNNDQITVKANQLHTSLVKHANQHAMRLGAYYGKRPFKGRFTRTNNKELLKRDWFHYYKIGMLTNRYAPYDKRAKVPRHFKIPYGTEWMMDKHGFADRTIKTPLYTSMTHGRWENDNYFGKSSHHRNRARRNKTRRYRRHVTRRTRKNRRRIYGRKSRIRRRSLRRRTTRRVSHKRRTRRMTHRRYRRVSRRRVVKRNHRRRAKRIYLVPDKDGVSPSIPTSDVNKLKQGDTNIERSDNSASSDYPAKEIVGRTNVDGYNLYHIMSDDDSPFNDEGWMLADEVNTRRRGHFNVNEFSDLIQRVDTKTAGKYFTSDEQQQIRSIKQRYHDLNKYENSSNVNDLPAFRSHVIDWVNFVRNVYGLPSVSESSDEDNAAQYGAEGCYKLDDIVHGLNGMSDKPSGVSASDWQKGIDATNSSNLDEGDDTPSGVVFSYLIDNGQSDYVPGHRCWILDPTKTAMGVGQKNEYNDLYVINSDDDDGGTQTLYYPQNGIFPVQWATNGAPWSLMLPNDNEISSPDVTVTDETTGQNVPVSHVNVSDDYGDFGTVNFMPDSNYLKVNHKYNISVNSSDGSWNWSTRLFTLD